jgi:hypothetical protein
MIVAQPELPIPLVVQFPFPAWATRASEAGVTLRSGGAPGAPAPGAVDAGGEAGGNGAAGAAAGADDPFAGFPSG